MTVTKTFVNGTLAQTSLPETLEARRRALGRLENTWRGDAIDVNRYSEDELVVFTRSGNHVQYLNTSTLLTGKDGR